MATILIISTNRERMPYPAAPIGCALIASSINKMGHKAHLLDLSPIWFIKNKIAKTILEIKPDIIGFSMRNLDNGEMFNQRSYLNEVKRIIDYVRSISDVPLIIGGPGFSIIPAEVLRILDLDYGVVGEGEKSITFLLNCILSGKSPNGIPGIITRNSTMYESDLVADLDSIPLQDFNQIPLRKYLRWGGFAGIQTRRGCSLNCIYCNYPQLEGRQIRLRNSIAISEEIALIQEAARCRHFYFVDSVFNFPPNHAYNVCEAIIHKKLKITWQAYINPIGINDDLARMMKESGCVGLELGVDSACDLMLDALGKQFTQSSILKAISAIEKAKIPYAMHLLFGGPGETWDTIQETAKFIDRHIRANAIFASIGIRVYPNTPIYSLGVREGWINKQSNLIDPFFYCSPQLGTGNIPIQRLNQIVWFRPSWTTSSDWNKPSMRLIMQLAGRFQERPMWARVSEYGKRRANKQPKPTN